MEDTPAAEGTLSRPWPDWTRVVLLLLFATAIHGWLLAHSCVAARDSIGYIRYALRLESTSWASALPSMDQHPGYPLAVMVVSWPVRYFGGGVSCDTMVLSAQLASGLAAVLLVVPMFFLGRLLFDARVGFWAALLFQCLPVAAHVLGDALSEAVFFLLLTTALLLAAQALRDRSVLRSLLSGVVGALAYLTRPEGALAVAATFAVLIGIQVMPALRWPRRQALACAAALVVGWLSLGGPYMAAVGGFSPKPTARKITEGGDPYFSAAPVKDVPPSLARLGPTFAVWLHEWPNPQEHRVAKGFWAMVIETVRAYQYAFGVPALLGIWWFRDRLRTVPGAWVILLTCVLHAAGLWRMAVVAGYVSERHALLLVLGGSFWAAAGMLKIVDAIVAYSARFSIAPALRPVLATALMLLATGSALPSLLKPLHANRVGHREAGRWLAEHAGPDDIIVDPFCWAHFYAGAVFREGPPPPPGTFRVHWVVLEDPKNPHPRLGGLPHAKTWAGRGAEVYHWVPSARQRKGKADDVFVFRVPAP